MDSENAPQDPIPIIPEDDRLNILPSPRPRLYGLYMDAVNCMWGPSEITLSQDRNDYLTKLTPAMRIPTRKGQGLFATLDRKVNINLAARFINEIDIPEVRYFWEHQIAMENIHNVTYNLTIDAVVMDETDKHNLQNAIINEPVISKIADYVTECTNSQKGFPERLLRMALVEGVIFQGQFCFIYWLGKQGLMPGLSHANELIARDETLHTLFALELYMMIQAPLKLTQEKIHELQREVVELSCELARDSLPHDLAGMNAELMSQYIKYHSDNILSIIGSRKLYNVKQPFGFMDQIDTTKRHNFFEKRGGDYAKPTSLNDKYNETTDNF